ncbi:putative Ccc1 family protein [Helianthus annuus]|uniref:Membrane protein of ER body-like protein n=1 Tax=Helianthus annuus TaxID=4232 RepID=A0A251VLU8_HELAN|nr:membrane protein of ER body-like protein isoform X2 [Helianthus annuus]KAJ0570495.1 putative Ccc1 family protein [Helianthus annuus]KAJ0577342.1 putative Ccc1 family protein [Helianthus annuus]KAJ0584842.1 putative Ccc1 family protein [Helianthus annuus]KAJ0919265.1 putative Ccc1 family protein [Helianthus annuus]
MENSEVEEHEDHPWDQEEEELEEGNLVARRKILNQTPISTTINADHTTNNVDLNGVTDAKDHHHHQQQQHEEEEEEEEKEEVKDSIQQDDIKVDGDEKEKEKEKQPEFLVYYDTDKGNEKIHEPENTDITTNNQENGNGMHSVISKQNGEHQKHEISSEGDKSASSYISNKTEITIDEITEYDVETILKKQDTHDLFCPNCNSCITKRVILRKRKRRIPVPGADGKRNKPETPVSSESNVVLADSTDDQVQPPTSNEYDPQREPDVFRCLSCFSIFMPTGNGFKLFRGFGNKNSKEKSELSEKEVPVKKSWFSNIFKSEKVENNVTNLNVSVAVQRLDPENNVGEVSSVSSNLNPSMQEASVRISDGTTDLEKNQLQSDKVISESHGNMATDLPLADTNGQLLTSYHIEKESNSKSEYPGMFVVKPPLTNNVEPTESSISSVQHDGLKLLVPPNVGSLIIDNSQMNQELDVTIQHTVQNNVEIHLEEPLKVNKDILTDGQQVNLLDDVKNIERNKGEDTIITIESKQLDASAFQRPPDELGETSTPAPQQAVERGGVTTATRGSRSVDMVKSIVYGGLIELIASLSVVASAAGADAATLNVLALGLANIFGGLFVISHDLWDLKNERTRKTEDRYQLLLGQRADFPLHMTVSLLSYLVFGFVPPLVYCFSFYESNDKDLKLLTVAAASILGIMILSAGRAYVQSPPKFYFKTISYHVMLGFTVSGVSYLSGGLIIKLLEKLDIFQEGSVENLRIYGAGSKPGLATF